MKYARIVVFSVLALVAAPTVARPLSERTVAVAVVEGAGFLQALACGACIGTGAALMVSGWGPLWSAAMGAGGGALAVACFEACAGAV